MKKNNIKNLVGKKKCIYICNVKTIEKVFIKNVKNERNSRQIYL